jgi:heme-degrading monooxygenase HmoA
VDVDPVVRAFSFRPRGTGSAVDESFRTTILPDVLSLEGLRDAFVGRRSEDTGERVLVTVWDTAAAMTAATDEAELIGRLNDEEQAALATARLEVGRLAFSLSAERAEPPRILRIVRGTVRGGELETFVEEARAATLGEERTNDGLVALYLGITGKVTFVTVSAWTGWEAIEVATGGDIRRPLATKNSERLVTFDGAHYEILPNIDRPTQFRAVA